jgi:lipoyl(octanoyl) transferase
MTDPSPPIRLMRSTRPVPYAEALDIMAREVEAVADGRADDLLWFLEHPPLYTIGLRTRPEHMPVRSNFPIFETDRGGQVTYHGPGQRIVYVMLDVRRRTGGDVRALVRLLENCVIGALDRLGVPAYGDPTRPGIWVRRGDLPAGEAKIGALGLKVRRGVSLHGLSLNVSPDLSHFAAIVPCGLEDAAVTSLAALGAETAMESVDNALIQSFDAHLGALRPVPDDAERA